MELRDFMRRLGRRLWILVIIPVVAIAIVGYMASQEPTTYTATATVTVSSPSGQDGSATINQAAASLQSAATSQGVLSTLSKETKVPVGTLENGIKASRVGTSDLVELEYTGTDRDEVTAVAAALPRAAQDALFANSVSQAEATSKLARDAFDAAQAKVAEVQKSTGLILPDEAYAAKATEVTQLRVALVTAKTRADTNSAPIADALETAEDELAALGGKLAQFEQPQFDADRTRAAVASADADLLAVQARQTTAENATVVGDTSSQARTTSVVRQAVSAGLVGLAVAVLILLLSSLLGRSQARREDEVAGAAPRSQSGNDSVDQSTAPASA